MSKIMNILSVFVLLILVGTCIASDDGVAGFYRVKQIDGIWWFIKPNGEKMFSIGVTDCGGYDLVYAPPGTVRYRESWDLSEKAEPNPDVWVERLKEWGFTNAGAWKGNWNDRLPSTPCLDFWREVSKNWFGPKVPKHAKYKVPDVYSKEFAQWCDLWAKRIVAPQADNPSIIGWFVDNEIHLPNDEAFQRQFYETVVSAIRKYDTNHLLLGMRHESPNRSEMELRIEADFFDVLSFNDYGRMPSLGHMDRMYEITGKPMLIGEFAFGSKENSKQVFFLHEGTLLPTTPDRAMGYEIYASVVASKPYMVGLTYYRFMNWNTHDFGLVDWDGEPWWGFVNQLGNINRRLPLIHSKTIKPKKFPDDYPDYKEGFNDKPHFDDRLVEYSKNKNCFWQPAMRYWECTPETHLLTYNRHLDSNWASKPDGYLEYCFTLDKEMDDAYIYVRYSAFANVKIKKMRLTVNDKVVGVHHYLVKEAGSTKPEGFSNGYGAFRYSMLEIPLKLDLPAGRTKVRFEVDSEIGLWKPRNGLILHGFFLGSGKQSLTADDYGPIK